MLRTQELFEGADGAFVQDVDGNTFLDGKNSGKGADLSDILLTTLECIGLMTGDKLFLEQNKRALEQRK